MQYTSESEHWNTPRIVRDFNGRIWNDGERMRPWLLTPKQAAGIVTSVMRSKAYHESNPIEGVKRVTGYDGESLTNAC